VHRIRGDAAPTGPGDPHWLCRWRSAGSTAAKAVDEVLDEHARGGRLTGPLLAREVAAATGRSDLLVAAASNPVRDLDLAAVRWDAAPLVLANRGLSGVDGTLSTAVGAGLAAGRRGRALVGDLAFLHDLNGLLLGPGEPEPDLQVVVLNDDGGGIFGLLEYGEPRHADVFERVFGTPHGADLAALSAGVGVAHERVGDLAGLQRALAAPPAGRSVLEVRAGRAGLRDLHAQIAAAVRAALR
jgi:2-succinyl-5-enolpyruvyl-6-hydroxy-3-cyclohexene-1-carboxylate synthase